MNRKNKWLFFAAFCCLCCFFIGVYSLLFIVGDDRTPPVITMDADTVSVSVADGEDALLRGVSASDGRDGDVTASVVVEGISDLSGECTAVVTYAAFDSAGNVSKATRTMCYTDYEPPQFDLRGALVFTSGAVPDVLSCVSAHDVIDGDISRRVKGTLVSDTSSLGTAGLHQVEFRVTNSMGDTQYLTLPVEVCQSGLYNASVTLGDSLVRLSVGDSFEPEAYLKELIVDGLYYSLANQDPSSVNLTYEQSMALGRDRETDIRVYINDYHDPELNEDPYVRIVNVEMENNVRTGAAGIYSVSYTVDMDGRYTGHTRLIVIVEEQE